MRPRDPHRRARRPPRPARRGAREALRSKRVGRRTAAPTRAAARVEPLLATFAPRRHRHPLGRAFACALRGCARRRCRKGTRSCAASAARRSRTRSGRRRGPGDVGDGGPAPWTPRARRGRRAAFPREAKGGVLTYIASHAAAMIRVAERADASAGTSSPRGRQRATGDAGGAGCSASAVAAAAEKAALRTCGRRGCAPREVAKRERPPRPRVSGASIDDARPQRARRRHRARPARRTPASRTRRSREGDFNGNPQPQHSARSRPHNRSCYDLRATCAPEESCSLLVVRVKCASSLRRVQAADDLLRERHEGRSTLGRRRETRSTSRHEARRGARGHTRSTPRRRDRDARALVPAPRSPRSPPPRDAAAAPRRGLRATQEVAVAVDPVGIVRSTTLSASAVDIFEPEAGRADAAPRSLPTQARA